MSDLLSVLEERIRQAAQAIGALSGERDRLRDELIRLRERVERMERQQADAAGEGGAAAWVETRAHAVRELDRALVELKGI